MNNTNKKQPIDVRIDIPFKGIVKTLVVIGLFLVVANAVPHITSLLLQVMIAAFLAIAVDRVVYRLQTLGLTRGLSIFTVVVAIFAVLTIMSLIFIPPLVDQATDLADKSPQYVQDLRDSKMLERLDERFDIVNRASDSAITLAKQAPNQVGNAVSLFVGGVFTAVTFFFLFIFMLVSGGSVVRGFMRLSPRLTTPNAIRLMEGAYQNIGAYVAGAITIASIAGISLSILLLILGVPFALPLGLWMLMLSLIPQVGATIGAIPAILVTAATEGVGKMIVVIVFIVIYQQIENVLIQPRVQGKIANLSALIIFFSVLLGAQLVGVAGALFAVPIASVISIIYRQYLEVTGQDSAPIPPLKLH